MWPLKWYRYDASEGRVFLENWTRYCTGRRVIHTLLRERSSHRGEITSARITKLFGWARCGAVRRGKGANQNSPVRR